MTDCDLRESLRRFYSTLSAKELSSKASEVREWCKVSEVEILPLSSRALFRLREIGNPPPLLYARGNIALLELSAVAVVGTRQPSPYGMRASRAFSVALARRGYVIVSGLARGIDGAAHRGALLAGGYTIAVVGHGLDRVYPACHRGLAMEIVDKKGCVVSEYPPGVPPLKHHFPERNRILSGLSLGTLVIEAAEQSGSLITARLALEQNREVFVVPANFDETSFRGSHKLIQEGAKLVTHPDHLRNEFPPIRPPTAVLDDKTYSEMRELFRKNGGEVLLEDIMALSNKWQQTLDSSMICGFIAEVSPQRFAWIGEEDTSFFHSVPCQT